MLFRSPASCHMLLSRTKPCKSKRNARCIGLRMAHYNSNNPRDDKAVYEALLSLGCGYLTQLVSQYVNKWRDLWRLIEQGEVSCERPHEERSCACGVKQLCPGSEVRPWKLKQSGHMTVASSQEFLSYQLEDGEVEAHHCLNG